VAAILELDEHLNRSFKIFDAAPQVTAQNLASQKELVPKERLLHILTRTAKQESRGVPAKKPPPDYFL
jgi:hypothetical protein